MKQWDVVRSLAKLLLKRPKKEKTLSNIVVTFIRLLTFLLNSYIITSEKVNEVRRCLS